jgi:hypothetical protein
MKIAIFALMVAAFFQVVKPAFRERAQAVGRMIQIKNGLKERIRIIEVIL